MSSFRFQQLLRRFLFFFRITPVNLITIVIPSLKSLHPAVSGLTMKSLGTCTKYITCSSSSNSSNNCHLQKFQMVVLLNRHIRKCQYTMLAAPAPKSINASRSTSEHTISYLQDYRTRILEKAFGYGLGINDRSRVRGIRRQWKAEGVCNVCRSSVGR